jgi:hypothetical protein
MSICLILAVGAFASFAPSRAAERSEQRPQVGKSAHAKKSIHAKRSSHRRHSVAKGPHRLLVTGFNHNPFPGWYDAEDDEESPDFGVSLGNGCWDLPQYARLYGCDRNDFNW